MPVLAGLLFSLPPGAAAAPTPPPNDNRADATSLGALPQSVTGATVGATAETSELSSNCTQSGSSVWYKLSIGSSPPDRIGIRVVANGNLDAVVDGYQRQRSQNAPVVAVATRASHQTAARGVEIRVR